MDVRKFISSVDQDISRVSKRTSEISCSTREINNFIFLSTHVLFCLLYKIIVLLPHKNRAVPVNVNAFTIIDTCEIIMNNHTCEIIMNNHTCEINMNNHTCEIIDFISGGNINKLLYFI